MSVGEAATCAITKMLHALDLRDWQKVRDAFADHVDVDYSSLSGEPAANVAGDQLVGGWRSFVGAFDATQHMTGPCTATERDHEVLVHTHVRGYHRIADAAGGATWLVAGHYVFELRKLGVRIAAGSDPACASYRQQAPSSSPLSMSGSKRCFCSSVPRVTRPKQDNACTETPTPTLDHMAAISSSTCR